MAKRYRPDQFFRMADDVGDRLDNLLEDFQTRLCFAGFSQVVLRSPVWQPRPTDPPGYSKDPGGTLRGGWQISFDRPSFRERGKDFTGQKSINDGFAMLGRAGGLRKVWFSNGVPYAAKVEFGGFPNPPKMGTGRTINGFSTQAPRGMARESVAYMVNAAPAIARALFAERFAA